MSKEILESIKDFVGVEVKVGDEVVYAHKTRNSILHRDVVTKITPKGVTLKCGLNRNRSQIIKV